MACLIHEHGNTVYMSMILLIDCLDLLELTFRIDIHSYMTWGATCMAYLTHEHGNTVYMSMTLLIDFLDLLELAFWIVCLQPF